MRKPWGFESNLMVVSSGQDHGAASLLVHRTSGSGNSNRIERAYLELELRRGTQWELIPRRFPLD